MWGRSGMDSKFAGMHGDRGQKCVTVQISSTRM